jgi:hypothetical protein
VLVDRLQRNVGLALSSWKKNRGGRQQEVGCPQQGARGGGSGQCRLALNPPRDALALAVGAALIDRDAWLHEGGMAAQGGNSPGKAAVERHGVWWQAERKQGRDNDGAKCDGSGFSFATKCGGDQGGLWRRTWDSRPVGTTGDRSANGGRRGCFRAVAPLDATPGVYWGFSPVGLGPGGLRSV